MKTNFLTVLLALLIGATLQAQENIFSGQSREIVSPEMHADNSVTFRLLAPNADSVFVTGDFLSPKEWAQGKAYMKKNAQGVWEFSSTPLPSELYTYNFIVDGLTVNDPNNVYYRRDVARVVNVLLIGDGQADLYKVNRVPHGTVAKRWYKSPGNNMTRRITIYTPPEYEENDKSYPVLYLLHGMGGDEETWMNLGRTSQILDNLIAQDKAEPMIVVMPNSSGSHAPWMESLKRPFMRSSGLSIHNTELSRKRRDGLSPVSPWEDFIPCIFQATIPIPSITWAYFPPPSCRTKRLTQKGMVISTMPRLT